MRNDNLTNPSGAADLGSKGCSDVPPGGASGDAIELLHARGRHFGHGRGLKMNCDQMKSNDCFLELKEVQDLFGVSRSTIWRWQAERGLKVVRVGGVVRVRESDLKAFLQRHELSGHSADSS